MMKFHFFILIIVVAFFRPTRSECSVLAVSGKQEELQITAWLETSKASWQNIRLKVSVKNLSQTTPHEYLVLVWVQWPLLLQAYDRDGKRIQLIPNPREYRLFFDDNFSPAGSMWDDSIPPGKSLEIEIPLAGYLDTRRLAGGKLLVRWCLAYWNPPESTACIEISLPQEPQLFVAPIEPVKATFFPKVPAKRLPPFLNQPQTIASKEEVQPASNEWAWIIFLLVLLLVSIAVKRVYEQRINR